MSTTDTAFTQNWIQSLTLVAQEPVARQIKPLLDSINDVSRMNSEADRMASARRLWDFAIAERLKGLLEVLPVQQPQWTFADDETFIFERSGKISIPDFATWAQCIGVAPGEFAMTAKVTSRDWLTLVRQEAVRLQRSMNTAAMPQGMNLSLSCTAQWDLKAWSIRFDQADGVVVGREDPFSVVRPTVEELNESIFWMLAAANESLIPKSVAKCSTGVNLQPWIACSSRLESLHQRVLIQEANLFAPWFRRTWACVWPVVYREQNILRGQARLDAIRQELAACITNVPRLAVWMFVLAKLLCESQLGRGLGISVDYSS